VSWLTSKRGEKRKNEDIDMWQRRQWKEYNIIAACEINGKEGV
jgi:hypothetical protein